MATNAKDIELRVRARDYSQKTLEGVSKALDDLTKAQEEQLKSAKAGQTSANALEASYKKIEDAVKALIRQDALTKQFENQAAALKKAQEAADAARKAQVEFANSMGAVEVKTKEQVKTQNSLAKAVTDTEKKLVSSQNSYDKIVGKLAEFGIASDQVAAAQKTIANGVAQGNAALERQQAALDTVDADMRQAAATAQLKAAADKKAAADEITAQKAVADALAVAASRREQMLVLQNRVAKANYDSAQAEKVAAAALRDAADQAEATAKGYLVMGRALKTVRADELGKQLAAIADPAGTANKNIQTLTANLDRLDAVVAKIDGPVKDFRATMASLNAAMSATQAIGAQVTAYRQQIATLGQASQAYAKAKADVANLTAQMRAGGGDAQALGSQMSAALNTLKQAGAAFQQQASATNTLRVALKEAGVDTKNLDEVEKQLVANANKAAGAMKTLTEAYKKNGAAAEEGAKSTFKFFDNTRQSLSYTQRLRGELLALATGYIGLQAAINLAKEALEATTTIQKIQSQLLIASGGDAKAAAAEYDYLRAVSDRIGISFKEAAPAFGKFSIAAKSFGLSGQETRFVFEQLAEASRAAGLSASDFEGVLKAVEQMLSKGTIQAEELRGQLGDRLPGAFTLAAKAANMTTAEFTKALELGQISASLVVDLAGEVGKQYATAGNATMQLQQAQNRFNNAALDFQKQIADAGLAQEFTKLLNMITEFLQSAKGELLAKQIGEAFTSLVKVLEFCVENFDAIKIAVEAIIALSFAKWIIGAWRGAVLLVEALGGLSAIVGPLGISLAGIAETFRALGDNAEGGSKSVNTFTRALQNIANAINPLNSAYKVVMNMVDAFNKLRAAQNGTDLNPGTNGSTNRKAIDNMGVSAAMNKITPTGTTQPDSKFAEIRAVKKAQDEAEKAQTKLDKETIAARKKAAKDELGERADIIKEGFDLRREAVKKEIKDEKDKSAALLVIDKQEKQALQNDKIRFDAENAKSGAAAAAKELSLREQVKNGLLKIQDDLANSEAKTDQSSSFEERKKARIDAIAHAYDKLKTTISKLSALDKQGATEASKKLDAYVGQLQSIEEQKVTQEEVKKLEKELTDQQKLRQAGLDQEKAKYDAGLQSQEQFLANTQEINTRGDSAVKKAADDLQNFVDAAVKAKAGILSLTDQAEIKTKTTTATADSSRTGQKNADIVTKAEAQGIDMLIAKREQENALIKAQFDLRLIGQDEWAQKTNANNELYKQQIIQQTALLVQQLEVQKAQGIQEGTLTVERRAALDEQIAKYTQLGLVTKNTLDAQTLFQQQLSSGLGSGIDTALNSAVTEITKLAEGTESVSDAFRNLGTTVAQTIAQMLLDIGKAIAKQLILNALANSGGVVGQAAVAIGGVVKHSGGKVTRAGQSRVRQVNTNIFANAPRLHDGGIPGLKRDEVPAILQTGEQVLARDDPNNVLNGQRPINMENAPGNRFVLVDDRQGVPEAMASAEGESVTMVHLKRNAATIRQIVGR